jgi:hypothetical protein
MIKMMNSIMKPAKTWESIESCVTRLPAIGKKMLWTYEDKVTKEIILTVMRCASDTILATRKFKNKESMNGFIEKITDDNDFYCNKTRAANDIIKAMVD